MTKFSEPNFPALFTEQFNKLRVFDRELLTALSNWSSVLKSILDGGISIADNVDAVTETVVSHVTIGTEFSVSHRLGKVPSGYIVIGRSGNGIVYDGATTNTKTTLYLKSNASAVTFKLLIF